MNIVVAMNPRISEAGSMGGRGMVMSTRSIVAIS
jgi:hypothetical protein